MDNAVEYKYFRDFARDYCKQRRIGGDSAREIANTIWTKVCTERAIQEYHYGPKVVQRGFVVQHVDEEMKRVERENERLEKEQLDREQLELQKKEKSKESRRHRRAQRSSRSTKKSGNSAVPYDLSRNVKPSSTSQQPTFVPYRNYVPTLEELEIQRRYNPKMNVDSQAFCKDDDALREPQDIDRASSSRVPDLDRSQSNNSSELGQCQLNQYGNCSELDRGHQHNNNSQSSISVNSTSASISHGREFSCPSQSNSSLGQYNHDVQSFFMNEMDHGALLPLLQSDEPLPLLDPAIPHHMFSSHASGYYPHYSYHNIPNSNTSRLPSPVSTVDPMHPVSTFSPSPITPVDTTRPASTLTPSQRLIIEGVLGMGDAQIPLLTQPVVIAPPKKSKAKPKVVARQADEAREMLERQMDMMTRGLDEFMHPTEEAVKLALERRPLTKDLGKKHRGFGASANVYNQDGSIDVGEFRRKWHCSWCLLSGKYTPTLRKGPLGSKTLCNACGIWFGKHGTLPEESTTTMQTKWRSTRVVCILDSSLFTLCSTTRIFTFLFLLFSSSSSSSPTHHSYMKLV
ncbi:hypothetical protein BC829DRAFT_61296 [Chytridium lagenaria]|nr:hypothetical protein BC829DRAFT_61296 [Chytridium lagenaria]